MHTTFYIIGERELYHMTNDVTDGLYSMQLYFEDEYYYNECFKKIKDVFNVSVEGRVVLNRIGVYKLNILELTPSEGNIEHGFHGYTYKEFYIRVYWTNRKKQILFYKPRSILNAF